MATEWYKEYIGPGEEFVPHNLVVKVDSSGLLIAIMQHDETAHADHHFGGKYVGKHIEQREHKLGSIHSPVYMEAETNRFYYVRNKREKKQQ